MKITINVDCTPEEARRYMGLPDVAPMQEAVLRKMQEQMDRAGWRGEMKVYFRDGSPVDWMHVEYQAPDDPRDPETIDTVMGREFLGYR